LDKQEGQHKFKEADSLYRQGFYPEALQLLAELNRAYPNTRRIMFPMAGGPMDGLDGPPPLPEAGFPKSSSSNKKVIIIVAVFVVVLGALAAVPFLLSRGTPSPEFDGTVPFSPDAATPVLIAVFALTAVVVLGLHLFYSYLAKRICEKAGTEPGCLVWVPILQVFPMFAAAGMSYLWFLGFFVPFLGAVVPVLLFVKLCEATGKPGWLGVFVLLPGANLILPIYLAFAD